ncbi:unnamed protein product [Prorocentrum cordatum]|uniref:Uncharacterized protein n=1 Tax=Prorocentrum cordatum TaxID=2364126 RepID=A0ABN9Q3X6_9DINO|nr:unnamed protein product [Polarella glacialis]
MPPLPAPILLSRDDHYVTRRLLFSFPLILLFVIVWGVPISLVKLVVVIIVMKLVIFLGIVAVFGLALALVPSSSARLTSRWTGWRGFLVEPFVLPFLGMMDAGVLHFWVKAFKLIFLEIMFVWIMCQLFMPLFVEKLVGAFFLMVLVVLIALLLAAHLHLIHSTLDRQPGMSSSSTDSMIELLVAVSMILVESLGLVSKTSHNAIAEIKHGARNLIMGRPDPSMPAHRRVLGKASALALAAGACRLACRGGAGSAAFAPAAAAPAAPARAASGRTDAERDADARVLAEALRGARVAAASDLEPRRQSGGQLAEAAPETGLNPPWATCYVEAQLTTASVLEEWVMRGERDVVASFSAWRRSSEEPTSVRCVDTPAEDALRAECLECAAHDEVRQKAWGMPFAVNGRVSEEGVLTFSTGTSQCLESVSRGQGFCKSGQVLLG